MPAAVEVAAQRGAAFLPQAVEQPLVFLADDELEGEAALVRFRQDGVDAGGVVVVKGKVAVHLRIAQQLGAGHTGIHRIERHHVHVGGAGGGILQHEREVLRRKVTAGDKSASAMCQGVSP